MAGWIEAQDKVDSAGDKKGLVAKRIRMKRRELFIEIDYFRRVLRHSTTTRICKLTSEKVQLLPVPRYLFIIHESDNRAGLVIPLEKLMRSGRRDRSDLLERPRITRNEQDGHASRLERGIRSALSASTSEQALTCKSGCRPPSLYSHNAYFRSSPLTSGPVGPSSRT